MIIYSTTLNTQAKVIAIYGGTTWVQVDAGRTLIAAGTGYSIKAKAGSKDAIVVSHNHTFTQPTVAGGSTTTGAMSANNTGSFQIRRSTGGTTNAYLPSGNFTIAESGAEYSDLPAVVAAKNASSKVTLNIAHTHSVPAHSHTVSGGAVGTKGSSGTNANMPPYYVVYIWERTA